MNNQKMFERMMTLNVPKTASNTGKYSFGIVNSKNNGKRVTFNKALSHALGLTDKVTVMPDVEEGKVALCRLGFPRSNGGKPTRRRFKNLLQHCYRKNAEYRIFY